MKKKFLSGLFALVILVATSYGVNRSMNNEENYSYIELNSVEALAQSEQGCLTRPGQNDGHCTTNGTVYFCENAAWFDKKDCVK